MIERGLMRNVLKIELSIRLRDYGFVWFFLLKALLTPGPKLANTNQEHIEPFFSTDCLSTPGLVYEMKMIAANLPHPTSDFKVK